jgi:nitrate reductase (cytochrome), electron transfer subunit
MRVPERVLAMLAVSVAICGGIGFSIGVDPARYSVQGFSVPLESERVTDPGAAQPARSYAELTTRPWRSGITAGWAVDGIALDRDFQALESPAEREPMALREQAITTRALLRAYPGAPPVIPHPVSEATAPGCLACHATGVRLGTLVGPALPHEPYASCMQCHVPAVAPLGPEEPAHATAYASRFEPLIAPREGQRAWQGAPPTIPHSTSMRSNCRACHGPGGRAGLRSTHPQRASCLQCHALDAARDQRVSP